MGSTNNFQRFTAIDNLTQDWLIPYALSSAAIAVGVGDLMYDAGSDVAYPADQQASQSSEVADQALFASKFVGVSQEQVLSTEVNALKRFTVRMFAVCDFKCPSQTFNKGDMVGIYSDGVHSPDPQQVDKVTQANLAIGIVVKYYGAATTTVRVLVASRKYWDLASRLALQGVGSNGLVTRQIALLNGHNDDGSALAAAASSGKFGIANTDGTSAPALITEAAQNNTKTDTAIWEWVVPDSYNGGAITVTVNAQHIESGGTTLTNTINLNCYAVANAGTEGSDLINVSAKAITGSAADYAFTVPANSAGVTAGARLVFKLTGVATEGGNTGTTKDQINSIRIG